MSAGSTSADASDGHEKPFSKDKEKDGAWAAIAQSLHGLRYGQVTIIVQDGRVIQIDRTERHRLNSPE